MNVNQKIEAALSDLVNGNIWPLSCPFENTPGEFIVYCPDYDYPADFGNDDDLEWVQRMEINWFKRSESRKVVNYIGTRSKIRSLLKSEGFTITNILCNFEKETGYTHLTVLCSIMEDNPYG